MMDAIGKNRLRRLVVALMVVIMAFSSVPIRHNGLLASDVPEAHGAINGGLVRSLYLVSPPTFTGHAVFDMLDLRGIEIYAEFDDNSSETWLYNDITPGMISWEGDRDLNYRADFIANPELEFATRNLVITAGDEYVIVPIGVQRYAFTDGMRFGIVASPHHPMAAVQGGELMVSGGRLEILPTATSWTLGPDGKFPAGHNAQAVFEIVHNIGNQVGYGILAVDDGRVLRADLAGPGWGFWADWDHYPQTVVNNHLWRIIRLPNGYHALVFFNHDANTATTRAVRPVTAPSWISADAAEAAWDVVNNPQRWEADPNLWFIINPITQTEHDVPSDVQSVGNITSDANIGTILVGDTLTAGDVTFVIPGNPVSNVLLQWYSASAPDGVWTAIDNAIGNTLTVTDQLVGRYIRVAAVVGGYVTGSQVSSNHVGPVTALEISGLDLLTLPDFQHHAVFDMLDLRGLQIGVTFGDDSETIWGYEDLTPSMISWEGGRDLNHRADFMANQTLQSVTRTLIITIDDVYVEVPIPVQRYAFPAGTRFSVIASSRHPEASVRDGELRAHFIGPHSTLFAFPNHTSLPLGADGKFPPTTHDHAVFEIIHNGGNQIGYGLLAVDDGRVLRTDLGGNFNFWADWDHFPGTVSNNFMWRIIRLPNGYHTLVFFNHDTDGRAPRAVRPTSAAAGGTAVPGDAAAAWNHIQNPGQWDDPYRWFIINTEFDIETAVTSIGPIETDGDIADIKVGDALRVGAITFEAPGNPIANSPIMFQWYRGVTSTGPWNPVIGETGGTYILDQGDYGHYIRVAVVPYGLVVGAPVFSDAVGAIGPGDPWTISSRDIASIRLLEMGWIEIMWRDRMAFDAAAGGDTRLTSSSSYVVTINGTRHNVGAINNVRRGNVYMTSLQLANWQELFVDWQLNPAHANNNPSNFPWLRPYDVVGDPHGLFTFDDNTGIYNYTGYPGIYPGVPLNITLQIAAPLDRFGTHRPVDTSITYDVFYTPFYHHISEYKGIWTRQSGNVVDPVTNHLRAAAILTHMLSHDVVGDVITDMLVYRGFNNITCGVGENTDHVPEFRGLAVYQRNNPPGGYGSTQLNPANYTASGNELMDVGTLIHEIAHGIDALALAWLTDHPDYGHIFQYVLDGIAAEFMLAIEQGWWYRTAAAPAGPQPFGTFFSYMMSNRGEFFALSTDIWFNTMATNNAQPQSREGMSYYHPALHALLSLIYPAENMPNIPGGWAGDRSPSNFNQQAPFTFVPNRGSSLVDGEIVRDDFSDVLINFGPMFIDQTNTDTSAANIRTSADGRQYRGQYFAIRHFMNSHIIGGGAIGSQAHTWWDYSHTSWNHQFCSMSWVVREVPGTGEYEGRTFLHFTTKGNNPRRGTGNTDTRFGSGHEIPGVFSGGGNALGMTSADNAVNSAVTFVQPDLNDPNQLWYLIGFQGRFAQIANKASGLVISTVNDMSPGDGILLELIEWQPMPNFGALWRVMQLKPNPVGGTDTSLIENRYAIVPEVFYDAKMQDIWIDPDCDRTIWIRWQEAVDNTIAGDIENYQVVLGTNSIALVQEGSVSFGNITRLMLAEPASQAMFEGLGARIRFIGDMETINGLPVNNQIFYNFRRDNFGQPAVMQLTVPTNLSITNTILTWDAVENSSGYRVYVNGTDQMMAITTPVFDLATLNLPAGTHQIQVRAIGWITDDLSILFESSSLSQVINFTVGQPRQPVPTVGFPQTTAQPNRAETQPQHLDQQPETDLPDTPQQPTLRFDDVNASHWFYGYVNQVAHLGLFQGIDYRTFAPQMNMTRAMFVQVLANMKGIDLASISTTNASFDDVNPSAWYAAAIGWAFTQGIAIGIGENNFAPNAPITREQMAVMLHRFVRLKDMELQTTSNITINFADQHHISYWATEAVNALQAAGIIEGRLGNSFDPLSTATRAEAAAVFVRLAETAQ